MSYAAAHRPQLDQVDSVSTVQQECKHWFRYLISGPGATCPRTSGAGLDRQERGEEVDRTEAGTEGARGE